LLPPYGDYSKSKIFARAIKHCGLERSLRCGIKPHLLDCPIVEGECRPARGSVL
jgi:hypothetical protein